MERKNQQKPANHHSLSTNPPSHPPQPSSHPKNLDWEGKKKKKTPLTLTDSRSEILATAFLVKPDPSNEWWWQGSPQPPRSDFSNEKTGQDLMVIPPEWRRRVTTEWRRRVVKGASGVDRRVASPMGVVIGLGKCERGWVKYEKGGERVGYERQSVVIFL